MSFRPNPVLHGVVWTVMALHLLLASLLPLSAFEAHYALYARDPALSYLDHPPLAAWLQAPVVRLASDALALRLVPIALSVLALYLLARLTRRIYPEGSCWLPVLAVLILAGSPIFHASLALSPDAPLLPLALGVMLATLGALEQDRVRDWLLLGIFLGLAGLSKYTAVLLAVSVLLLAIIRLGWRAFAPHRLWLTGGVAFVLITPVLVWNWQHDWITLTFHAGYQFEEEALDRSAVEIAGQLAEQILFYSPLWVLGGVWALQSTMRAGGRALLAGRVGIPIAFALPALAAYLAAVAGSRGSAHWSLLGWVAVIPLVAAWLHANWRRSRGVRLLGWSSALYSTVLMVVLALIPAPWLNWPDFRHPARQLLGWEAAAEHGRRLLDSLPADGFSGEGVLLARNWHHARILAWYQPQVGVKHLFNELNPHTFQFGLADHRTWGVLVYPRDSAEPLIKDLTRDFNCEPIDAMPVRFGASLVQVFHFYACYSRRPAPVGILRDRR